jgi:hypothetical protein
VKLAAGLGTVVAQALAVVLLSGGVAVAAWPTNAPAADRPEVTVTAGAPSGDLYPEPATGYPSPAVGAVSATVSNPGAAAVRLTTATLGRVTITAREGQSCASGSVVAASSGPVGLGRPVELAPGATAVPVTLPGAVRMLPTAENGCQGALVTVEMTFTGSA